jgi:cellulase
MINKSQIEFIVRREASEVELRTLCSLPGVSGDEYEVHQYLSHEYQTLNLDLKRDKLGSIFGERQVENSPFKVMISSNIDECGGMIDDIHENGLLSFVTIGDVAPKDFLHQRVCLLTRHHQRVYGYVLQKQEHYWIHIGAKSLQEVEQIGVQVGDTFVLEISAIETEQMILSKNISNRAGVYAAYQLMKTMPPLPYTLSIGGITQSIVGYRGAITATNTILPDVSIVLDVAPVRDYAEQTVYIRYFDKTLLPNVSLVKEIKEVAQSLGYEVKANVQEKGTDGSFIHKSLAGTPTVVVVIPLKEEGQFVQLLNKEDLKPVIHTLQVFLENLTFQKVQQLAFQESW